MNRFLETDILIIGAGAAGLAAAITVERLGHKAILVEKSSMLGGQATLAQVGTICGVYSRENFSTLQSGKFANKFLNELNIQNRNSSMRKHVNGLAYVPYGYQDFDAVSMRLLGETKVQLHLQSTVYDVEYNDTSVESVSFITGTDRTQVRCSTLIDATGVGLIVKLAGKTPIEDQTYQAPAYVFKLTNLELDESITEKDLNLVLMKTLADLINAGNLEPNIGRISVVPGSLANRSVNLKFAYPFVCKEEYNEITNLELLGRKSIQRIFKSLKDILKIFSKSEISMLASQVGIRSSSRTRGLYELKEDDVLTCKKFDDGVANCFWPIEFWDGGHKPTMKFFTAGDHYQIPARSLISADFQNLFVCGRGISADQEALSSARVIGTCFQSGVASGYLSSGYLKKIELPKTITTLRKEENLD